MNLSLDDLRALNAGQIGTRDVACPLCGPKCRTAANRKRDVLRIWDDGSFVTYKCARCEASGWAKDDRADGIVPRAATKPREPAADKSDLARYLWSQSLPLAGSLAETYLRSRQCFVDCANIRFLPARNEHPAAMIARFGTSVVSGVHLTKLRSDGNGKSGTEKDKIMIGPSMGQPIIVADNPDRGELLIAEGIEDAASLTLATGWSAWAAGSAGRIAACLTAAERFDKVFVAVDHDAAGKAALARARSVRADIIPLRIAKALGTRDELDANKALIRYGADALLAAVEWSEAHCAYARGQIGFHAMQSASARAEGVFRIIADATSPYGENRHNA